MIGGCHCPAPRKLIGVRSMAHTAVKVTIKECLEKRKGVAEHAALWKIVVKQKGGRGGLSGQSGVVQGAHMVAAKRALAERKKKKDSTGAAKAALKQAAPKKTMKGVAFTPGPETP